jgi:hypothetical protein
MPPGQPSPLSASSPACSPNSPASLNACTPPADDALNTAAGSLMHSNRLDFEQAVHRSVHSGATIGGECSPLCIAAVFDPLPHSRT